MMTMKGARSCDSNHHQQLLHQQREHHGFKRWLLGLSRDELLRAMVIRFQRTTTREDLFDSNNIVGSTTRRQRPRGDRGYGVARRLQGSNNGSSGSSHELDLLLEMVRLQSPKPTPIHPRAMGYRQRCTQSSDWAHLDYYWREEEALARNRPRLFQLIPVVSNNSDRSSSSSNNNKMNGTNDFRLDPEVERLLAMTETSPRSSVRSPDQGRNQLSTRTIRTSNKKHKSSSFQQYQIVARNKVAPWGDIYGLGQTWEQQHADRFILEGTRLILGTTATATASTVTKDLATNPCLREQGRGQTLSEMVSSACFVMSSSSSSLFLSPRDRDSPNRNASCIIRMLQVASRGNLFNVQSKLGPDLPSSDDDDHLLFPWDWNSVIETTWLQPIERWFGLSQYLAFRYQMALLEAYRRHSRRTEDVQNDVLTSVKALEEEHNVWNNYESTMLESALASAVRMSVFDLFQMECRDGVSSPHRFSSLRDSILWTLLNGETVDSYQASSTLYPNQEGWNLLPLTDSRSSNHVHFRALVRSRLDQQLAKEMSKAIYKQEEEEEKNKQQQNGDMLLLVRHSHQQVSPPLKVTRRRKKQTRRCKKNDHGSLLKRTPNNPLPAIMASEEESEQEQSSEEDDDHNDDDHKRQQQNEDKPIWNFPDNGTRPRERNRNIITALTILEEVIEIVFVKVGLPPTVPFQEQDDNANHDKVKKTTNKAVEDCQQKEDSALQAGKKENPQHLTPGSTLPRYDIIESNLGIVLQAAQIDSVNGALHAQPWHVPAVQTAFSSLAQDFYNPFGLGKNFIFDSQNPTLGLLADTDEFLYESRFPDREQSIFYHIFDSKDEKLRKREDGDDDENLMAASTAASISSSIVATGDELEDAVVELPPDITATTDDENDEHLDTMGEGRDENFTHDVASTSKASFHSIKEGDDEDDDENDNRIDDPDRTISSKQLEELEPTTPPDCRSPSPEAPVTPPPTLSPILVSLADLQEIKRQAKVPKSLPPIDPNRKKPESLPSSPVGSQTDSISQSWSREDLRMDIAKTQGPQTKRSPEMQTYRSVAVKNLARPIASSKVGGAEFRALIERSRQRRQDSDADACARSETALEGYPDDHIHKFQYDDADYQSLTKDETTTITSGVSHRVEVDVEPESAEISALREERNSWRDMCLTLGAEVAKLKAIIAAQNGSQAAPSHLQAGCSTHPIMYGPGSYDPHGMQPFFYGMKASGMRPGPMSDAGFHRGGDYESQMSEDEVYDSISKAREAQVDSARRMSSSQTVADSDISVDFNNGNQALNANPPAGIRPTFDSVSVPFHGLQSRLSQDILRFVQSCNQQLSKLDSRRKLAIERFSRLVKTIWPRAQIKPFGSYVSGLCLPSSDMDFVICLPAVHKKDVALAPGVLEGRNAINESSQKLLARELKGESWIDPRSIKLIERTVVPVIKVCTKDTRARMIQLDISFDSPEHHGLEASRMILSILDELPMIRPLMLVLKQFLLDRGLLTAYTGGLSSYCLFLMLARYLQEQPASNSDCGSLLMGFLDFHGNSFDPRVTGISVRRRQYFLRSNYGPDAGSYPTTPSQPMWTNGRQHIVVNMPPVAPTQSNRTDFRRHNSFSESGSVDGSRRQHHRFQQASTAPFRYTQTRPVPSQPSSMIHPNSSSTTGRMTSVVTPTQQGNGTPMFDFTFDPLFVEDPLSASNNVGRNAFRINQIQRVFSDAHRALVASLDWDIHSSADDGEASDYPLLKCLLQGKDVLYEL